MERLTSRTRETTSATSKPSTKEVGYLSQTYAEQLRAMRTGAGWSRPKMVERVGVPLRTIEDWEAGKATPPTYVQKLVLDRLQLEIEKDEK